MDCCVITVEICYPMMCCYDQLAQIQSNFACLDSEYPKTSLSASIWDITEVFHWVHTHMYKSSRLRIQAHQCWPTESCNMSPVFPNVTLNEYKDSGALLTIALQWQHERDGVANHRCPNYWFKHFSRRRSEKISKLCVTGLCEGNQPVTGGSAHMGWVTGKMFPFDNVIIGKFMRIIGRIFLR